MVKLFLVSIVSILCITSSAAEEIRFGATLTLTGGASDFGNACKNGITLAEEDINKSTILKGKKLKVLLEDFGDVDLKRAVAATNKFISLDKVDVVLANWSEDAEVIAPIAHRQGRLSMALGAGGPKAARHSATTFRATSGDDELGVQAAADAYAAGSTRACVVLANTSYYVEMGDSIVSAWKERGGTISLEENLVMNTVDVKSIVTKIKSTGCDTIFVWASPPTLAPIIRELRNQKVQGRRIIPWFADVPEVLEETKGDDFPVYLYRYLFSDATFKARYEERFKVPFMRPAGNCYDGIQVLAKGIAEVGTGAEQLSKFLLSLNGYVGVTGPYKYLPNRERTGERFERVTLVQGQRVNEPS